jgi:hypothetical protein
LVAPDGMRFRILFNRIRYHPILLGHNFCVHPKRIFRLLLPQGLAVPIAVSELFAVLQEIRERARQDSNLRPAD